MTKACVEPRRNRGLLFGMEARGALGSGMEVLGELVARTLGPAAGGVVASREARGPEVIRSGGVLARRIIACDDRFASVGMMLLRHGVWRVHEAVGDGGATTAALMHSLAVGGLRLLAGGVGAVDLCRGLERALVPVVSALEHQARPLTSADHYLSDLLKTAVPDRELGEVLGALFSEAGPDVAIDIEEYGSLHTAYRLVGGCRLHGRILFPVSGAIVPGYELTEPYVLVTTAELSGPRVILPLVESIVAEAGGPLVIVAPKASDSVLAMLKQYKDKRLLETVVWQPSGPVSAEDMSDLATLVGARPLIEDRGDQLERARVEHLGYTAWAKIRGEWMELGQGAGDPSELERRRSQLLKMFGSTSDSQERQRLLRRVGLAAGRFAVLEVGASTDTERKDRMAEAERAIQLVPAAMAEGVVAGGGASLLNCIRALENMRGRTTGEDAGVMLMRRALAAPATWLARNSRVDPGLVLQRVRERGADHAYDARGGDVRDMWQTGVVDAAKVVRVAVEVSVSTVTSMLRSEVLVLSSKPELSIVP